MSAVDVAVILRLVDQLSGPAKNVSKSLRDIINLGKQLGKVGGFQNLGRQFATADTGVKKLTADMRALGAQMGQVAGLSRSMAGSIAVNAGAANNIRAQASAWRQVAQAQQQVMRNQGRMGGGMGRMGGMGGMYAAAYEAKKIGHGISSAAGRGGNLQNEMTLLENLGLSSSEIKQITSGARAASSAVPQIGVGDTMHNFREMRYAFADTGHALESMVAMNKFMVTMSAVVGDQKMGNMMEQVYAAAKSAEMTNQINSPAEFQAVLDAMQQAAESSGGIVDPQKYFQALKYSRGAALGYNAEFKNLFLPEYIQELASGGRGGGGSRGGAGTALAAFKRMFVDQIVTGRNIPNMVEAGLIDPNKAYKEKGNWKLKPEAFYNQQEAVANPFRYIQSTLKPALERKGLDLSKPGDQQKAIAVIGQWVGTQMAQQLVQISTMMDAQMEKRAKMTGMSAKVLESYDRLWENYNQSLKAMKTQTSDMTGFAALPFLPAASRFMRGVAGFSKNIREFFATYQKQIEAISPFLMMAGGGAAGWAVKALIGRLGIGAVAGGALGSLGGPMMGIMGGMAGSKIFGMAGSGLAGGMLGGMLGGGALAYSMIQLAEMSKSWKFHLPGIDDADIMKIQNKIKAAFSDAGGWSGIGASIMNGLRDGLMSAGASVLAWVAEFVNKLKTMFSFTASPTITPNIGGGASGSTAPGGSPMNYRAPVQGGARMQHANVTIHINGANDPNTVARAVKAHLENTYKDALSDGYGVMPA